MHSFEVHTAAGVVTFEINMTLADFVKDLNGIRARDGLVTLGPVAIPARSITLIEELV